MNAAAKPRLDTGLCIVGAGPAGAMLAYLCARDGLDVTLLEKQSGFQREFRGEGISIGGVTALEQHGLLPKLPPDSYVKVTGLRLMEDDREIYSVDLSRIRAVVNFGIDIPQPTLLKAIVDECRVFPNFRMLNGVKVESLAVDASGVVEGLEIVTADGPLSVRSRLVAGCDGRYSQIRRIAGFDGEREEFGRDVVWFRLPRPPGWDPTTNLIKIVKGSHLIVLPCYPEHLRVGLYMPKGGYAEFRKGGIESLHREALRIEPRFAGLLERAVPTWKEASLLDIFTMNATRWSRDGLVLLGDAAHTCSPVLGQGVNLALQDAVELAPLLAGLFRGGMGRIPAAALAGYEAKRRKDIAYIQRFQRQNEVMLGFSTPAKAFLRRSFFRLLNVSPAKVKVMHKIQMGLAKVA